MRFMMKSENTAVRTLRQLITGCGVALISNGALAVTVTSIDFSGLGGDSEIKITADGPVKYTKEEGDPNQIVLKLDAALSNQSQRKIDTSSFENSPVKLISPYNIEGGSKIVIQLRNPADANITGDGNQIQMKLANSSATPETTDPTASSPSTAADATLPAPATAESTVPEVASGSSNTDVSISPQNSTGTQAIDQFLENRESRRFSGRPVTLKVRDAELTDIFRLISETSGFSIVMNDNVKGKVTLAMESVPWDQVLDVVLKTHQLGAERNGNLLRIATLQDLTTEKTQELQAKRAAQNVAPRITRLFVLNFANIDDLTKILTSFANSTVGVAGAGASGDAALVQADKRTNTIIVRDVAENIERMRKLIELLDTQTPQVMIEGKVIEATESFGKTIEGRVGFGMANQTSGSQIIGSSNGGFVGNPNSASSGNPSPINNLFGGAGTLFSGPNGVSTPGNSTIGFSPRFGFLPGLTLDALLNLSESENNLRVVASPKTVVIDRETARILQSTPVLVPAATTNVGGAVSGGSQVVQANLSLEVTPSVTNEGSVLLQLTLSRDIPQTLVGQSGSQSGVGQRNMTTKVLVDSGSTLVIGGVYTTTNELNSSGVPFLRKIPLIGALFGKEESKGDRTELFFFITPRILNPREAGLGG